MLGEATPRSVGQHLTYGVTAMVSFATPWYGGAFGYNLQYNTDHEVGLYVVGDIGDIRGFGAGASLTGNVAVGHGPWDGPFKFYSIGAGDFAAGLFLTTPDVSSPREPSYAGVEFGASFGTPGGASGTLYYYDVVTGDPLKALNQFVEDAVNSASGGSLMPLEEEPSSFFQTLGPSVVDAGGAVPEIPRYDLSSHGFPDSSASLEDLVFWNQNWWR